MTHKVDHLAGADAVIQAHPAQVLGVLPTGQHILVAHVVGAFIHHPGPALNADGVATAQVGVKVRAVAVAVIPATLEVLVLVKDDLEWKVLGMAEMQWLSIRKTKSRLCLFMHPERQLKTLVH